MSVARADYLTLDRASLLDAALDAIVSIDAGDLILEFNPSAERLFGWTREEALGRSVSELLIPARLRDQHRAGVARVAAGGAPRVAGRRAAVTACRADGTEFPAELTVTVSSSDPFVATAFIRDLTARRRLERRLRHLAEHDPLTGLVNRHHFEDVVQARLSDPAAEGAALLVLDLDHFKFVNDSFGHATGDNLIRVVAGVLRDAIGRDDVLARLGGDEFAVLLGDADGSGDRAMRLAQALLASIEEARPSGLRITASAGVACVSTEQHTTASDMLVAADIALYEAKDAGRARATQFGGRPGESLAWVDRIRAALNQDRFVLFAQPIVDLRTGETVQEELLLRMRGEHGGLLPPGAFLPPAESFGLVGDLDRWVLARSVRLAAQGRRVHVNLSGASVGSRALVEELADLLADHRADPQNVVIELTETVAVANIAEAREFALALRGLGCGLALDDFGTGFGSFTYLKHLPSDYLKLDLEFVRDVATAPRDREIVGAIVGIARRFDQVTVAEGIEDEACASTLRDCGVQLGQGFHLGRPAQADGA